MPITVEVSLLLLWAVRLSWSSWRARHRHIKSSDTARLYIIYIPLCLCCQKIQSVYWTIHELKHVFPFAKSGVDLRRFPWSIKTWSRIRMSLSRRTWFGPVLDNLWANSTSSNKHVQLYLKITSYLLITPRQGINAKLPALMVAKANPFSSDWHHRLHLSIWLYILQINMWSKL